MVEESNIYNNLPNKMISKEGYIDINILKKASVIGVYFSAHWCGPCKMFTPILVDFYNIVNKTNKKIEIVFISSDHTDEQFKEYYSQMPWLSIPFECNQRKCLSDIYNITGIPSLLIFNNKGELIDSNGRKKIMNKGIASINEWLSKEK